MIRSLLHPVWLALAFVALNLGLVLVARAEPSAANGPVTANIVEQRPSQPVVVADLKGRPILDENRSVMGYVRGVVRTDDGHVQLLMPIGGLFGFGERLVPIPIESVTMLGKQIAVTDMPSHRFQKTPTWYGSKSESLAPAETIQIALTK